MNQTYATSTRKIEDVTFDDLVRAKEMLDKLQPPYEKIQMCKKHWKLLSKHFISIDTTNNMYYLNSLLGMKVEIKPHLKKVRLYRQPSTERTGDE